MKSGATLIASIFDHGQADEIMAAAKRAGARGGTIIEAQGTAAKEDAKFFGICLTPEKEMLLIVADQEHCEAIVQAVSSLPIFAEPGGGIVFTLPIEEVN